MKPASVSVRVKNCTPPATRPKDCRMKLDDAPTLYCVRQSCAGEVVEQNKELRSKIGRTERGQEQEKSNKLETDKLDELLDDRLFRADEPPPPLRPVFKLAGAVVSTRGSTQTAPLNWP